MRVKRSFSKTGVLSAGVATGLLLAGSAASPAATGCNLQETTVFEYKMPEGRVLRYQLTSSMKEVADIMGLTRQGELKAKSVYSFQAKGRQRNNLVLGVTVDEMDISASSDQGSLALDTSPVKGKSFDMVLSPAGTEADVSGAEAITIDVAGSTRNIAFGFKTFFPHLPDRPVKVGDSWPLNYTVEDKSSTSTNTMTIEGVNTLEGFETVEGLECARISSKYTGTLSGSGRLQGVDMTLAGKIVGTDVIYFAPREGIYVQSKADMVREITASISGPQNLTIPSTQTSAQEVKLVAR